MIARGSRASPERSLLRALAIGLSVYRLYPDSPTASSFVTACDAIRVAATTALRSGPVRVEVRSAQLVVGDEPVTDPGVERLAEACFERRVELVGVDAVPTVAELRSWFELLSTDVDELDRAGGVSAMLHTRGISSILTTSRAPQPSSGEDRATELLGPADWTIAEQRSDELGELQLEPGESGPALYTRLSELAASLSDERSARTAFFQRAGWVVADLPRHERAVFGITLFDRVTNEGFAERYVGHLTDVALADMVADVAWFLGLDPVELAAEVAVKAGRHATLVQLFETGAMGVLRRAVAADEVVLPDDPTLVAGFPETPEEGRVLAATALVDVLLNGPRQEHLEGIVDNLTTRLREAVVAGAPEPVRALLGALDEVARVGSRQLVARTELPRQQALDPATLSRGCAAATSAGRSFDPQVLIPFDVHAVAPLIAALGDNPDGPTRSRLLVVLGVVGAQHIGVVTAALDRQSPERAVRLAPMVAEATGLDVVSLLSDLALRAPPPVLHEVIDALADRDPDGAAPVVARITRDAKQPTLRDHGLVTLARLPRGVGRAHLEALASRNGSPLPWRARGRARRLARQAGRRS